MPVPPSPELIVFAHLESLYFQHHGDRSWCFPSEVDLAVRFKISRSSVRNVWEAFAARYAIRRVKKLGTVVDRTRPWKNRNSHTVGLVIPIGGIGTGLFVAGFVSAFRDTPYSLMVKKSLHGEGSDDAAVRSLMRQDMDAIALWPTSPAPASRDTVELFSNLPLPFLAVDHPALAEAQTPIPTHLIEPDNQTELRAALHRWIDGGRTRIIAVEHAALGKNQGALSVRMDLYRALLAQHGLTPESWVMAERGPSFAEAFLSRLDSMPADTAYFFPNDHDLEELIPLLSKRNGRRFPELLAFTMDPPGQLSPQVHWIHHDPLAFGSLAGGLLLQLLQTPVPTHLERHVFPARFIPATL